MTTWFVTRHKGAIQWARAAGVKVTNGGIVPDLDVDLVNSGDLVVGTLPINLAAEVMRRGATYQHLALELPFEARGKELSAEDLRRYGARLENYHIELLGQIQHRPEWDGSDDYIMLITASAQTMPNVLPILARKSFPKRIYIIVSNSDVAKQASRTIAHIAGLLNIPVDYLENAPTAPLSSVQKFAEEQLKIIRQKHPAARVVFNASGGTKIMSNGISRALGPIGEVIYCDTENDRIEYSSPQGRDPDPLPPELTNLETYLLAKGVDITDCASSLPGWMDAAHKREKLTRYLVSLFAGERSKDGENAIAQINWLAYLALPRKPRSKNDIGKPWEPLQESTVYDNYLCKLIQDTGLWEESVENSKMIKFADQAAAEYLGGGWIEEFAALTMEELGVDQNHWGVGVRIRPREENLLEKDEVELNELDLAVVWRNRLLVVECKTGTQVEGKESQNILNKLEAIRSYAADSFGTFWLLSVKFANKSALERAKRYRINLYEREAITILPLLIANWMKLNNDDQKNKLKSELEKLESRVRTSKKPKYRY